MSSNPAAPWPFDQPRNAACLVTRQVVDGAEPIVRVSHDADDHGWQFLGRSEVSPDDARVLALQEIVEMDPSVWEVADIPPGWQAVRERVGGPWIRLVQPLDPEDLDS